MAWRDELGAAISEKLGGSKVTGGVQGDAKTTMTILGRRRVLDGREAPPNYYDVINKKPLKPFYPTKNKGFVVVLVVILNLK